MSTPPQHPEEPDHKPVQEPTEAQAPPAPNPAEGDASATETSAKKADNHALRNIGLIAVGLVAAIVLGFLVGRGAQESGTGQVSATAQSAATPQPTAHPPSAAASPSPPPAQSPSRPGPSPTPSPTVLADIQGTGIGQSDPFNAPSQWKLNYNFDCTGSESAGMEIELYQDGTALKSLVNDAGSSADATLLVNIGGSNLHLVIHSQCSWRVKATT